MKRKLAVAGVVFSAVFAAGQAQAAYQTVFGEDLNGSNTPLDPARIINAFDANTAFLGSSNAKVEDFETLPLGPGPLTLAFGSGNRLVNATLQGGAGAVVAGTTEGRYSVLGGTNYWSVAVGATTSPFSVMFDQQVEAFGFFGIDIGDFGGTLSIELLDGQGNVMTTRSVITSTPADPTPSSRNGAVLYYGITASDSTEWFRGVRFVQQIPGNVVDAFGFDSFTVIGAPRTTPPPPPPPGVPEPASLALVGAALLGLAISRRRA